MKPRKTWMIGSLPEVDVVSALDPACIEIDPQKLLVVAGAGISVDRMSWLPTARDFLKVVYEVSLPETFDWSRLMISDFGPRFELVLDILQANFDPDLDILSVFRSKRPNHNHRCLAALARQGALVVTTNFDVLIEAALAETGDLRCAFDPEHFASLSLPGAPDYTPTIWHLHGIIEDPESHEKRPETIVASIRDVWHSRHLFRLEATKGMFLARALKERDLLVVGYSGSDDYDIMPLLVDVPSDRTVIWVDHHLFEPTEGPAPSVQQVTFEGDCWYRDSPLNALAEIIDQRKRPSEKVRLLKYKSSHVLQTLSGLRDVDDPVDSGPIPLRPPSIIRSPVKKTVNWLLQTTDPAFRDLQLAEILIPWTEKHLPSRVSRYQLALALCEACGLRHEQGILRSALTEEAAAHKASGKQINRDTALGMMVAITASPFKAIPDQLLPFVLDYLDEWRVASPVEALLEGERALFERYPSQGLSEAEKRVSELLSTALEEANPTVIARASLLLARITERAGRSHEIVIHFYDDASKAAYDSGSQALIGRAQGEMGLYLSTKVTLLLQQRRKRSVDVENLFELARQCIAPLAEAYRIHAAQGDYHALQIVAGNLADCLDLWEDQSWRSLRAHCIALFSSVLIQDINTQRMATERIQAAALDLIPDLDLHGLKGEDLARTVLSKLDEQPDSLI